MAQKISYSSPDKRIRVDADTIQRSIRGLSSHCMVAEAVKQAIPEARYVSVDLQTIRWTDKAKGLRYIYLTPASAQQALVDFDQGEAITPFTFRLSRAQVIPVHGNREPTRRTATAESNQASALTKRLDKAVQPKREPAKLEKVGSSPGAPPVRVGGQAPPTAALSSRGRVRAYGLRNLKPPRLAP